MVKKPETEFEISAHTQTHTKTQTHECAPEALAPGLECNGVTGWTWGTGGTGGMGHGVATHIRNCAPQ